MYTKVLIILGVSSLTSCSSEFSMMRYDSSVNYTDPLVCTPDTGGSSTEADVAGMKKLAESVAKNSHGFYEASFGDSIEFIYIPKGPFEMGSDNWGPDERPAHTVNLSGYWIAKNLVTNNQFRTFIDETGYVTDADKPGAQGCYVFVKRSQGPGGEWMPTPDRNWLNAYIDHPTEPYYRDMNNLCEHPVGCVSWYDSMAYGDWLSEKIGLNVTLPSEAQWEKAARGTDGRFWPWGNTPPDASTSNFADAKFNSAYPQPNQGEPDLSVDDGWSATSPVGIYPAGASPYGVLDMAGNTTQWVYDIPGPYPSKPVTDPIGYAGGKDRSDREMRGGFWLSSRGSLTPTEEEIMIKHSTRSDLRAQDDPRSSDDHLGFRVVIDYCARD